MTTTPRSLLALRHTTVSLGALAAIVAVGCGDLYSDPGNTAGSNVASADPPPLPPGFRVDASATIPRDFVKPCPAMATEGESCNSVGLTCEYGSSPDQRCNTTLACESDGMFGTTWTARPSILCPSYACPGSAVDAATIDGTPCAMPATDAAPPPSESDELICPMGDGVCACTTGVDAAHAHARSWVCVKPASGCPRTRPLVGQSCGRSDSACDYGSCAFKRGMVMRCDSSGWMSGAVKCN